LFCCFKQKKHQQMTHPTLNSKVHGTPNRQVARLLYRGPFRHMGRNVVIGRGVTLRHPHKISIGDGVLIDDDAVLDTTGISARVTADRRARSGRTPVRRATGSD